MPAPHAPLPEFMPIDAPSTSTAHDGCIDYEPARPIERAPRPTAAQLGLSPVVEADPDEGCVAAAPDEVEWVSPPAR